MGSAKIRMKKVKGKDERQNEKCKKV